MLRIQLLIMLSLLLCPASRLALAAECEVFVAQQRDAGQRDKKGSKAKAEKKDKAEKDTADAKKKANTDKKDAEKAKKAEIKAAEEEAKK